MYLDGLQEQLIPSPVQWLNTQDMTQTQLEQEVLNIVNNSAIEVCGRRITEMYKFYSSHWSKLYSYYIQIGSAVSNFYF